MISSLFKKKNGSMHYQVKFATNAKQLFYNRVRCLRLGACLAMATALFEGGNGTLQ